MYELDSWHQTVLHHACSHCSWSWRIGKAAFAYASTCSTEIINLPSLGYAFYFTPLMLLCDGGGKHSHQRCTIAKVLINRGADLETCDKHGNTPFLIAASAGFVAMMELLYTEGANIHAHNILGAGARGLTAMCSSTANAYATSIGVLPSWKSHAPRAVRCKSNAASQQVRGQRSKLYRIIEESGAF